MTLFILGLALFFAPHVFTFAARGARDRLRTRLSPNGYKGLYSLVSLAGFALIYIGWPSADASQVYAPPAWGRHVTQLFMLLSLIVLASGYLPKGKIAAAVQHPMLAGVKLWAFGHLFANGEVRSLILFGAFLAYAVLDRIAVKRRGEKGPAAGPAFNDAFAVVAGVAAWAVIYLYLHPYIAGVALAG